jgi:hypothetical protein
MSLAPRPPRVVSLLQGKRTKEINRLHGTVTKERHYRFEI